MNIAVQKLPTTIFALSFALAAAGASSIARAEIPSQSAAPLKTAVNYSDLNLGSPAGAMTLYRRLKVASRVVCRPLETRTLSLWRSYSNCIENALGNAVHDTNQTSLVRIYLGDHGAAVAAKYGIPERVHYATK